MTTEIKTRNLEIADDTDLRKQEVKIGDVWIETPIKTITPNKLYAGKAFPKDNALIEIFKKFKPSNIEAFLSDPQVEGALNNSMNNLKNRGGSGNPSVAMIQYYSDTYPTEDEIKRLSRISHVFSDITPVPSIPKLTRSTLKLDNPDNFFNYIDKSVDFIKQRNKKPIMGYIPIVISTILLEELLEKYFQYGINAFYIDFDGTQMTTHSTKIDTIKGSIAEHGYEENHFLYFVNANCSTNAIGNSNVVPAKDIIGFALGLDSFGGSHVPQRRSREYYEWLSSQKNVKENSVRIFDKENYGYHKVVKVNKEALNEVFPRDSVIPLDDIEFSKTSAVGRTAEIINLQQQIMESKNLITKIKEAPGKTLNYFESKKYLDKGTLKKIKK